MYIAQNLSAMPYQQLDSAKKCSEFIKLNKIFLLKKITYSILILLTIFKMMRNHQKILQIQQQHALMICQHVAHGLDAMNQLVMNCLAKNIVNWTKYVKRLIIG